jgi:hypothetical protein
MAYRKQLKDKNGNVVYPDVGILGTSNIAVDAITDVKIADGALSNIKLANGSVSNSKIANGAVTSDKIDWSSMVRKYVKLASAVSITENNQGWATITIPEDGDYYVFTSGRFVADIGSNSLVSKDNLLKNGSLFIERNVINGLSLGGTIRENLAFNDVLTLSAGDVIQPAASPVGTVAASVRDGAVFCAIKIG